MDSSGYGNHLEYDSERGYPLKTTGRNGVENDAILFPPDPNPTDGIERDNFPYLKISE